VIADAAAGLFDEHVAWRATGALDTLFGIAAPLPPTRGGASARISGAVTVTAEGHAWGLRGEEISGMTALEAEVRAAGGKALLRVGGADVAIANRVAKGWAIYLNALLDGDAEARRPASDDDDPEGDPGTAWRTLMRTVLAHVGVKPAVAVTDRGGRPLSKLKVTRYRFGEYDVVALLNRDLDVKASFGTDGVTVYDDARLGKVARKEVAVNLRRSTHVTNARTGEALGRTDRLRTSLTAGDALILTLGPECPVLRLSGPPETARGEVANFTASFSTGGKRLTRWLVFGPDGAFHAEYSRTEASEGAETAFALPSALNDPPGVYRLQVTDVLSGATAETALRLE
jgi:hypothetical protein